MEVSGGFHKFDKHSTAVLRVDEIHSGSASPSLRGVVEHPNACGAKLFTGCLDIIYSESDLLDTGTVSIQKFSDG